MFIHVLAVKNTRNRATLLLLHLASRPDLQLQPQVRFVSRQYLEVYRVECAELWDTRNPLYKLKNITRDENCWINEYGKNPSRKKMRCLIEQFHREEKKCHSLQKFGTGLDDIYESKWFAFKLQLFLKNGNKPRDTIEAGIVHEKVR